MPVPDLPYNRWIEQLSVFARRLAEVWESSGFGPQLTRMRRHRLFLPLLLGAMIILAMALAGIGADEALSRAVRLVTITTFETSSAWWALPPALIAAGALAFSRVGAVRSRWFVLGAGIVVSVWILRYQAGVRGALPYLAVREVGDLFAFGLTGLALWGLAQRNPALAPAVLGAGLSILALARWIIGQEASTPSSPDMLPILVSLPFVIPSIIYGRRIEAHPLRRTGERASPTLHLMGLSSGALAGGFLRFGEGSRVGASSVADAVGGLWSQSVLFGHGQAGLMRLVQVYLEPVSFEEPSWMGWTGFLASGGVAAALGVAAISGALLFAEAWGRVRQRPAAMAVQFLVGLMAFGGPNSMIPLMLLFIWAGLALSAPPPQQIVQYGGQRFVKQRLPGLGARSGAMLMLAIAMWTIRGPFKSSELLNEIRVEDLKEVGLEHALNRAERLNPWNPAVPLVRAAWLREQLTRAPRWDETLYRSICDSYAEAIRLDPYDPAIVLKLAEVQTIAERPDEAIRTARLGLERNPGSQDLRSWILFYASSSNMTEIAGEMIERSLYLKPEEARWWRDRFRFEGRAGRASEADAALGAALTAAVANPREAQADMVRVAFERSRRGAG
jgi:hypothetical protein